MPTSASVAGLDKSGPVELQFMSFGGGSDHGIYIWNRDCRFGSPGLPTFPGLVTPSVRQGDYSESQPGMGIATELIESYTGGKVIANA